MEEKIEMNEVKNTLAVNEILLRRKHLLVIPEVTAEHDPKSAPLVLAMIKNIESLGFIFSADAAERLLHYGYDDVAKFYKELVPQLKKLVGADVEYHPMYPNFPAQVAEASDVELFINAIVHYISFGTLMPDYEKEERLPLLDNKDLTVLGLASDDTDDLLEIVSNLLSSKTSLSSQDRGDIEAIILSRPDYSRALPEEIPLKENVAFLSKLIVEKAALANARDIQRYFSTATDVLRFVVALSDGDISLAEKTKFRSLKRKERRMVMDLLAGLSGDILEDLFRYRDEWIRVAEIVHVGEYNTVKYMNVYRAFNKLRNEGKPLMFGGKVEEHIKCGKYGVDAAADMLMNRPGDFARRLDKLLRESDNPHYVLSKFVNVADRVSTNVLLQVRQHFIGRGGEEHPVRVFFPKGSVANAIVEPNNLPKIDKAVCDQVVCVCTSALLKLYGERDSMGNVYVDPEMKNFMVPFSQRSASSGNKLLVRGSSDYISAEAKTLRAFIWWTNTGADESNPWSEHRVDIDLSACILDDDFKYVDHVSYTRLRSGDVGYHSGDITNGGSVNGAGVSEFLDIDIDGAAKRGRYVCFQVYSFTGQSFSSLPNCRFGWMEREDMNSGEIYEPSTVEMCIKLASDSKVSIPVIFDCKEKKLVWLDMNMYMDKLTHYYGNNVESNLDGVRAVCYAMMHLNKPSMYDLIRLNALARGCLVEDRNAADIIFSNDTTKPVEFVEEQTDDVGEMKHVWKEKDVPIVTAFDLDYFMGKLL